MFFTYKVTASIRLIILLFKYFAITRILSSIKSHNFLFFLNSIYVKNFIFFFFLFLLSLSYFHHRLAFWLNYSFGHKLLIILNLHLYLLTYIIFFYCHLGTHVWKHGLTLRNDWTTIIIVKCFTHSLLVGSCRYQLTSKAAIITHIYSQYKYYYIITELNN